MKKNNYWNISSNEHILVRVWKACNFKCNFCNISYNERKIESIENYKNLIIKFLYKLKYSSIKWKRLTITITWWEPSILKVETLFILKYIKNFLKKKWIIPSFEIQTNASNIDFLFAKKLNKLWVYSALISFHTIDKNIFEKIIWVSYDNFFKIQKWIFNLYENGIDICTNTILSSENKDSFFDTIKFLNNNFPFISDFNVWLIQPHWDALTNIDKIYPKYIELSYIYNKAIEYLIYNKKNVTSHYFWLPACYTNRLSVWMEFRDNINFRKDFILNNKTLINSINDSNKIQTNECNTCLFNNICSWIWKEYLWLQKLAPLKYKLFFWKKIINKKNSFWYLLKDKNENLKKLYDSNIRQLVIKSSLGNKNDIYKLFKNSTQIWFYKITFLIDNDFSLEDDIFLTWVSNIQVDIKDIRDKFIVKLIDFSKKYSPQFRIDLDIFYNKKVDLILFKKFFNKKYIRFHNKNYFY